MRTPPTCGSFGLPRVTASANTIFQRLIPPFVGSGAAPKIFKVDPVTSKPNWMGQNDAFTQVVDLYYTSLSTAHSLYLLKPLNYTWATTAQAASTTTVTVVHDPGLFATKMQYPLPALSSIADNAWAAADFVAFQLNDGTWRVDKCATNTLTTTLVLTTGVPATTGCTIPAYSPIFWFGVVTDTDPNTAMVHQLMNSIANTSGQVFAGSRGSPAAGIGCSLHKGDPMVFHSSNGTDAGSLEVLAGFYARDF